MERKVLYYTNKCPHSRKVIRFINEHIKPLMDELELVDINDKQNPDPIPRFVDRIPLLLIVHNGNQKLFADQKLREWLLGLAKRLQAGNNSDRNNQRPPSGNNGDVGIPQPAGGARPEMTDPRHANGNGLMEWSSSELLTSSGFSDSYSAFNPKDDGSQYQSCSDKFVSINGVGGGVGDGNTGMGQPLVQPQLDNGDAHDYNQSNRQAEKEKMFQEDLAMKEAERRSSEPKRPNNNGQAFDPESFNKMWVEKNRGSQAHI